MRNFIGLLLYKLFSISIFISVYILFQQRSFQFSHDQVSYYSSYFRSGWYLNIIFLLDHWIISHYWWTLATLVHSRSSKLLSASLVSTSTDLALVSSLKENADRMYWNLLKSFFFLNRKCWNFSDDMAQLQSAIIF